MTQEELTNVFKYIVKKCDMLINNGDYEADAYTQDAVEDIAELCNHILDGDYGKLVEVKEVDLEKELKSYITEVNLESLVRQVIDLYLEAGKHYDSVIKEERKEYGGSDLAIKLFDGVIDAKELSIQYVLDKLKAQKGE